MEPKAHGFDSSVNSSGHRSGEFCIEYLNLSGLSVSPGFPVKQRHPRAKESRGGLREQLGSLGPYQDPLANLKDFGGNMESHMKGNNVLNHELYNYQSNCLGNGLCLL